MADHEGIDLVRRWWTEVWGAGRLELIPELFTDPYVRHTQNGTARRSHAELAEDMQQYRRSLSGCVPTFESQMAEADRVFSRITTTGVNLDTGESVVVRWLQEHRLEDGKLAETWTLYTLTADWDDAGPSRRGYPNTPVG